MESLSGENRPNRLQPLKLMILLKCQKYCHLLMSSQKGPCSNSIKGHCPPHPSLPISQLTGVEDQTAGCFSPAIDRSTWLTGQQISVPVVCLLKLLSSLVCFLPS